MDEDKLTDFERAEYYRARLKARNTFTLLISILTFIAGFALARFIYLLHLFSV